MKASSYPVLNNRPIDQWKVTELKEELKRRKLTTKGLKDDLIKRLDEALRNEMEAENQEAVNGNDDDSQLKGQDNAEETAPVANESVSKDDELEKGVNIIPENAEDQADAKSTNTPSVSRDDVSVQAAGDDSVKIHNQDSGQQVHASPDLKDESVTDAPAVERSKAASENAPSEPALTAQGSEKEQIGMENLNSRTQPDEEDIKPSDEEAKHIMSDLNNQVSEVNPSLGFPVKNDSISADSMTINEKNELKDNIIADDVKLEPDVKHEIMEPSSSPVVPDGGESHPMDVEEPQSKVSDDETNNTVVDVDMSKKNCSADLGSPEKLNLDRSSGDDSMEEDTLESKQVDSTYNSDEVGGRNEKIDVTLPKEESPVDVVGDDLSADKKDGHADDKVAVAASTEKRKLPDQETLANNEPSKRQRRWKTESIKISEPQSSSPPLSTTPKGTSQVPVLKRSFSRSNSNSGDDPPKERVVPPPLKPPTDSLRIDNFLRPFTLKAVQELLGKTGTVTSFWMDHIKTHCYVTYLSVEEAIETRNAVYNLQWPPNGGRLLAAEFVDAQEVKSRMEGPPQPPPAAPVTAPPATPVAPLQPSPRQVGARQKQPPQTNLPPPPPLTAPPARERLQPPPPPPSEKVDPPVLTLDDLFKKTKATPRIYYLPLSEEQVRAKLEVQRRNPKQ